MKKYFVIASFCCGLLAARAQSAELTAVYSLPFSADYQDFVSYDLAVSHWSNTNNTIVFTYVLPEDLIGTSGYKMTMFGNYVADDEFFQIFCDRTSSMGMCIKSGNAIACSVKFKNIPLNADVTHAFLDQKYGDDRIVERKSAADSFLRDAIGNISIEIKQ